MNFSNIVHPVTQESFSIFSYEGKNLLKQYVKVFQSGGSFDPQKNALLQFMTKFMNGIESTCKWEVLFKESIRWIIRQEFSTEISAEIYNFLKAISGKLVGVDTKGYCGLVSRCTKFINKYKSQIELPYRRRDLPVKDFKNNLDRKIDGLIEKSIRRRMGQMIGNQSSVLRRSAADVERARKRAQREKDRLKAAGVSVDDSFVANASDALETAATTAKLAADSQIERNTNAQKSLKTSTKKKLSKMGLKPISKPKPKSKSQDLSPLDKDDENLYQSIRQGM